MNSISQKTLYFLSHSSFFSSKNSKLTSFFLVVVPKYLTLATAITTYLKTFLRQLFTKIVPAYNLPLFVSFLVLFLLCLFCFVFNV